jgi:hypothetical protein
VVTFASPQSGKCVVNTAGSPTSGSVTNSGAMTSGMPVLGDGGTTVKVGQIGMAGIAASILTGNGPKLATSAGIPTAGNCARFDAAGNVTDAGSPCGTGSGTGTLSTSTGLEGTGSAGDPLRINPTAIPQKLTGWIGWQPGPLAAGGCAVTTIAIPGAAPGDMVAPGWPLGAFQTGANHLVWGEMFVSAAGTVTIKLCNGSASTISFSSETYKAAVLQ